SAHHFLQRAATALSQMHPPAQLSPADTALMDSSARMLQLMPNPAAPVRQRVAHILADRTLAHKRFDTCSAQLSQNPPQPAWHALASRWSGPDATVNASTLAQDPLRQDAALRLIYDTE